MTKGIVYVAWGAYHVDEAIRSARENKSGLPASLITYSSPEGLPLFGAGYSLECISKEFDKVIQVDFSLFDNLHPTCRKWVCFTHSPYDVTMFCDSDCFILQQVDMGMKMAEEGFLCMPLSNHCMLHDKGVSYVHYSTGIMFYNRSHASLVPRLLEIAHDIKQRGHILDEAPVAVLVRQDKLLVSALPVNYHVNRHGQSHTRRIHVYHSRIPSTIPTHLVSDSFGLDIPCVL